MSADFTNYDATVESTPQHRFAGTSAPGKYNKPCPCGHIGAECFNDEYCQPKPGVVMGWEWNQAAAYWHEAYSKRSAEATATEIELQNRITELMGMINSPLTPTGEQQLIEYRKQAEHWRANYDGYRKLADTEIEAMRDVINDLQADCAAWASNYHALNDATLETAIEQEERIADLETTIRVLSGLVNQ